MRIRAFAALVAACLALSTVADAHVIPADVTVRIFVKAEGSRLRYLVRMPMASINDIDWPISREDGTLLLASIEPALRNAATQWLADYTDVFEDGTKLPYPTVESVRLSLEGDGRFSSYDTALAGVTGPPVSPTTKLLPTQGMLDALFDYPIRSADSKFSIHPRLDRLGLKVTTNLAFLRSDGTVRTFEYEGGDVGLVHLDPLWSQAVSEFAQTGFFHVLDAPDLLLLLLCLLIPFRAGMIPSVVAFAAGQAVTMAFAAYGFAPRALWFTPLIAALTAAAIFLLGLEAFAGARLERRPRLAYACGVVYGFQLAMFLEPTLQFGGSHPGAAIASFGLGTIAGEVFTLLLIALAIELLFQFVVEARMGSILLAAIAAHAAWHWMADRIDDLRKFQLGWPAFDTDFAIGLLRWATVLVVVAAVVWLGGIVLPAIPGRARLFDEAADGRDDGLRHGLSGEGRG